MATRRSFLRTTSKAAAGMAVAGPTLTGLFGCNGNTAGHQESNPELTEAMKQVSGDKKYMIAMDVHAYTDATTGQRVNVEDQYAFLACPEVMTALKGAGVTSLCMEEASVQEEEFCRLTSNADPKVSESFWNSIIQARESGRISGNKKVRYWVNLIKSYYLTNS